MDVTHNPLNACVGALYQPNKVFAKLKTTSNWSWVPFLLVMIFSLYPILVYLNAIDFQWFKEYMVSAAMPDASPAEQNNYKSMLSPNVTKWSMMVGTITMLLIFNSLFALYLKFTTRSDEENINDFGDWFGFMWWVSLPSVLTFVTSLVIIWVSSSDQLPLSVLMPTSVSYWFDIHEGSKWINLTNMLRLDLFYTIYLIAVGISQFTRISGNKAWTIAIAPFGLIFAIMFLGALSA